MYPVLPFGPITIPTGPLVALIAVTIGLEIAGRFGRQLQLSIDDVWNTGLLWVLVSLIVARFWNVIQFWPVYIAEPWLMMSLRPSGFVWSAGLMVGLVAAYLYLWRRALSPLPVTVALTAGAITAAALWTAGAFLTGTLIGLPSEAPWALPYYGVLRHPVALYYATALALIVLGGWFMVGKVAPGRLLLLWLLAVGILLLFVSAYEEGGHLIAGFRVNQLIGFLIALIACWGLAQRPVERKVSTTEAEQALTE